MPELRKRASNINYSDAKRHKAKRTKIELDFNLRLEEEEDEIVAEPINRVDDDDIERDGEVKNDENSIDAEVLYYQRKY